MKVYVTRLGFMTYRWRAWGTPARTLEIGCYLVTPELGPFWIASGYALTARGARRRGERVLRRYCYQEMAA